MSSSRLTPAAAAFLTIAPLLWAANAVVGRLAVPLISPVTLNLVRWLLAFLILLPLGGWVLRRGSGLWSHWRRFALLGLLGVGAYNALQYLALQTSSPLNVTLVASSMPLWMLAIGRLFFQAPVTRQQVLGVLLSMSGVALVLARGDLMQLAQLRLVPGDLYILAASICWAWYSWLLSRRAEPDAIRNDWAAFILAQIAYGVVWSGVFAAGEWSVGAGHIQWSGQLVAILAFVAIGPAVVAYRCWSMGVQRAGPAVAGFFSNLTPVFAAIMSTLFLGEAPRLFHALAFALIVAGIVVSSRR